MIMNRRHFSLGIKTRFAVLFFSIFLLPIFVYAKQVDATNQGIANASPGDYIIRSNGNKIILKESDINYARKQLGLGTVAPPQTNEPARTRTASKPMDPFTKVILIIIGIIILVLWVEWQIGKAIGKCLSKETGVVLGVVLIFLGVTIFIGLPIIIYSRGAKTVRIIN
jgi:hypothetical protein